MGEGPPSYSLDFEYPTRGNSDRSSTSRYMEHDDFSQILVHETQDIYEEAATSSACERQLVEESQITPPDSECVTPSARTRRQRHTAGTGFVPLTPSANGRPTPLSTQTTPSPQSTPMPSLEPATPPVASRDPRPHDSSSVKHNPKRSPSPSSCLAGARYPSVAESPLPGTLELVEGLLSGGTCTPTFTPTGKQRAPSSGSIIPHSEAKLPVCKSLEVSCSDEDAVDSEDDLILDEPESPILVHTLFPLHFPSVSHHTLLHLSHHTHISTP